MLRFIETFLVMNQGSDLRLNDLGTAWTLLCIIKRSQH